MSEPRPEPEVHLHTVVSEDGTAYVAGRDQHFHYGRGSSRTETGTPVLECPYPGLAAFQPHQARWFRGRKKPVSDLLTRLDRRSGGGVQMVIGPSGAGKSSVLRAGLLPALAASALPGSDRWTTLLVTPTADPMAALADALGADGFADDPLTSLLTAPGPDPDGRLVLVVDQFEELFTLCSDQERRREFVDLLAEVVERGTCLVVIGLRADFFTACVDHPVLQAALEDSPLVIGPMTGDQLRAAVVDPARDVGLDVEPGLVELLLADLGVTEGGYPAGRLPLLAHTLRATWLLREGHTLTVRDYRATGGIAGAIATTAELVVARLHRATANPVPADDVVPFELDLTHLSGDDVEVLVRTQFLRLVRIWDNAEALRRRRTREDLLHGLDPAAATVLNAFTTARLVSQAEDSVEITHEALVSGWPRLRTWIDTDRAGNIVVQEVEEAAAAWDGRDVSPLYRGTRLRTARAATRTRVLSSAAQRFLAVSTRHQRRRSLAQRVTAATVAVLLVTVGATVLVIQRQDLDNRHRAELNRLAAASQAGAEAANLRDHDPALGLLLGVAAYRVEPAQGVARGRSSLLSASGSPHGTRILDATAGQEGGVAVDSRGRLLGAAPDGSLRLWDPANDGQPIGSLPPPADPGTGPSRIVASEKGTTAAQLVPPSTIVVHDLADQRAPTATFTLDVPVFDLALDPAGSLLAVGTDGNQVRLYSLTDPRAPTELSRRTHESSEVMTTVNEKLGLDTDHVGAVRFARDGSVMAVGVPAGTIVLWNIADPRNPVLLRALPGERTADELRSAGTALAVLTKGDIHVWNLADLDATPVTIDSSDLSVELTAVALSAEGDLAAVGASDGRVRLYDLVNRRLVTEFPHPSATAGIEFGPASRFLVTASADRTAHLWHLSIGVALRGEARPTAVGFAGGVFATSLDDGRVELFTLSDRGAWAPPTPVGVLPSQGEKAPCGPVEPSPDGKRLLCTDSGGGRMTTWDIAKPDEPVLLHTQSSGTGMSARYVPGTNGRVVAVVHTSYDDDSPTNPAVIRLQFWNVEDPRTPTLLWSGVLPVTGPRKVVFPGVVFSPDDGLAALYVSAGAGYPVALLDVSDPKAPRQVSEIPGRDDTTVRDVAFGDGHVFVHREDVALEVWSTADREHPTKEGVLSGPVRTGALAVGGAGRIVASTGDNNTVVLWASPGGMWTEAERGTPMAVLSGHTGKITDLAFDPGGTTLASVADDGTSRLWDTDFEHAARTACAIAGTPLTAEEWRNHIPALNHQELC